MPPGYPPRIVLWRDTSNTSLVDDTGVQIAGVKSAPQAYFQEGPYVTKPRPSTRAGVPSLQLICLAKARELFLLREDRREMIADAIPAWRAHNITSFATFPEIEHRELLPGASSDSASTAPLKYVDPLKWALVIQLVKGLPDHCRSFDISLSDVHLPTLQHIPDSDDFNLITVLNLESCRHVSDDTVVSLRLLHALFALNLSHCTDLSTKGISRLRQTLIKEQDSKRRTVRRGPWRLRILWLRGCALVDDDVLAELGEFPLLCVVDLNDTKCSLQSVNRPHLFKNATSAQSKLYYPSHLLDAANELALKTSVLPSTNVFKIYIDKLHPDVNNAQQSKRPSVNGEDGFVTFSRSSIHKGSSHSVTEAKRKPRDDSYAHDNRIRESMHDMPSEPDDGSCSSCEGNDNSEDEASGEDENQGVAHFYDANLPLAAANVQFLKKLSAYPTHQPVVEPAMRQTNPFLLYRKPPSHTELYKPTSTANKPTTSMTPRSDFATMPVNRTNPHITAGFQSLHKQLARKQAGLTKTVRPADGFATSSSPSRSRNPFLAKPRSMPEFGAALSASNAPPADVHARSATHDPRTASASGAGGAPAIPTLTPPDPNAASRALKGISALAVPVLPSSSKKRPRLSASVKGQGQSSKRAKQAPLDPALLVSAPKLNGPRQTNPSPMLNKAENQTSEEETEKVRPAPKERRKSVGSIKAAAPRARETPTLAHGKLDMWLKPRS